MRRGPVIQRQEVLKLPAPTDKNSWKTVRIWSFCSYLSQDGKERGFSDFFLRFLPALVNIAKGELHFVGVRPLSNYKIKALPPDWQALYLKSKAGIVTEAFVMYGDHATEDEMYSTEAFYSVMHSFPHDLKLLIGYFARLMHFREPAPTRNQPNASSLQD